MLRLSMVDAKRRKALSDSFSESTLSTALIASSSKGARVVDKSSGPALIASTSKLSKLTRRSGLYSASTFLTKRKKKVRLSRRGAGALSA